MPGYLLDVSKNKTQDTEIMFSVPQDTLRLCYVYCTLADIRWVYCGGPPWLLCRWAGIAGKPLFLEVFSLTDSKDANELQAKDNVQDW